MPRPTENYFYKSFLKGVQRAGKARAGDQRATYVCLFNAIARAFYIMLVLHGGLHHQYPLAISALRGVGGLACAASALGH